MSQELIAVPVQSRRRDRGLLIQKLQHVVPAGFLLLDGVARFGHDTALWSVLLATAEVASSTLVIGAFARALRHSEVVPLIRARDTRPPHASHGVDWVDITLAAMLMTEAFVHQRETGHLPRPTILLAAVTFMLGVTHGRIRTFGQRRRELRVSEKGVSVGGRFFSRFTAEWPQIAQFELTPSRARIVTRAGVTRVIDLAGLTNTIPVANALIVARDRYETYRTQHAETNRLAAPDSGGRQPAQTD